MQSFFVFGFGGTITKFKSKLSMRWSRCFHRFNRFFEGFSIKNFPFLIPPASTKIIFKEIEWNYKLLFKS